jgi:hypothetical protein
MISIDGTFTKGQVVLDGLPDWPEGCRLHIEPVLAEPSDNDAPESPEEIEEWLRWYRSLEPLEFTPEEEAELASRRQKRKVYTIAKTQQRIEDLFE